MGAADNDMLRIMRSSFKKRIQEELRFPKQRVDRRVHFTSPEKSMNTSPSQGDPRVSPAINAE